MSKKQPSVTMSIARYNTIEAEVQRLEAKVQELEVELVDIYHDSHECQDKLEVAEAKVQELEDENAHLKADVESLSSLVKKMMKNRNRRKADAIEEMYNELRLDLQSCGCSLRIPEYADKLREGNPVMDQYHEFKKLCDEMPDGDKRGEG